MPSITKLASIIKALKGLEQGQGLVSNAAKEATQLPVPVVESSLEPARRKFMRQAGAMTANAAVPSPLKAVAAIAARKAIGDKIMGTVPKHVEEANKYLRNNLLEAIEQGEVEVNDVAELFKSILPYVQQKHPQFGQGESSDAIKWLKESGDDFMNDALTPEIYEEMANTISKALHDPWSDELLDATKMGGIGNVRNWAADIAPDPENLSPAALGYINEHRIHWDEK